MTIRNLDALLRPAHVWFLGRPEDAARDALLERLRTASAPGFRHVDSPALRNEESPGEGWLAIVGDLRHAGPETVARLAELGCRALIWPHLAPPGDDVLAATRTHCMRLLGPRSGGLANPGLSLDLTTFPQSPLPGSLALIVQSRSVASAAADWTHGRRIGFSWIAVTGGEADVDVADLLDHAALDPATHAVALELGRIRGGRKFLSAARACARAKPTVVLQTRPPDRQGTGADPARSAAFARAGLVEVPTLPALFDAIAALQRLPVMGSNRVLTIANGAAVGALSVDAVVRHGLVPAALSEPTREAVSHCWPRARFVGGAVDLGDPPASTLADATRLVVAEKGIDAFVYVRSPIAGQSHESVARTLVAASPGTRLLTVWLGLEEAVPAREISAIGGQPTFTSPDAAMRAIRYRYEHARNRELLTLTPPEPEVPVADAQEIARRLAERASSEPSLRNGEATSACEAYGVPVAPAAAPDAVRMSIRIARHAELGLHLRIQTVARGTSAPAAYGWPPLDPLLAGRMLESAGLAAVNGVEPDDQAAIGEILVRVARFAMDQPAIASLDATAASARGRACLLEPVRIELDRDPPPERERLALAPYPVTLAHDMRMRDGHRVHVRPVRPSDEPALIRLLEGLDPESVRLRFFSYIRYFTHAMAARMTQIDYDRETTLVAFDAERPERMIGIATLIADPDRREAEFALLVDRAHGRGGLGRHLLDRLVERARSIGVGTVVGDILAENGPMTHVALAAGFRLRRHAREIGALRVELPLSRADDSARKDPS